MHVQLPADRRAADRRAARPAGRPASGARVHGNPRHHLRAIVGPAAVGADECDESGRCVGGEFAARLLAGRRQFPESGLHVCAGGECVFGAEHILQSGRADLGRTRAVHLERRGGGVRRNDADRVGRIVCGAAEQQCGGDGHTGGRAGSVRVGRIGGAGIFVLVMLDLLHEMHRKRY